MPKYNLSIVQKICFAGIFIVLTTICQKVLAINYIAVIPFVRISFCGPALIIFSSILLGPWFGLLVGAASDLLGFLIFDPKMFGSIPFFQITLIYALLGFASYFVFKLVYKIKSKKIMVVFEASTFLALILGITLYINLNDSITLYGQTHYFNTLQRVLIPILSFILLSIVFLIVFLLDRKFKKDGREGSIFHVSFASFILEITVMLIFGTIMKTWAFGTTTFIAIFIAQILVSFFNVSLNTFFLFYIMDISKKLIRGSN